MKCFDQVISIASMLSVLLRQVHRSSVPTRSIRRYILDNLRSSLKVKLQKFLCREHHIFPRKSDEIFTSPSPSPPPPPIPGALTLSWASLPDFVVVASFISDVHITWDEQTIAEHDKLRGTRQKIDEPSTPFHYGSGESSQGSDCESSGTFCMYMEGMFSFSCTLGGFSQTAGRRQIVSRQPQASVNPPQSGVTPFYRYMS